MPAYDRAVLQRMASRLYTQAMIVIAKYTILFAIAGAFLAPVVIRTSMSKVQLGGGDCMIMLIGALVMGAIGFGIGMEKAFYLKVEAQKIMCQVQIEWNTHLTSKRLKPDRKHEEGQDVH